MIAREGLHLILIGLVLTTGLVLLASRYNSKALFVMSLILGLLTVFTTFFFRDPPRSIRLEPGILTAPADGRILAVEEISDSTFVGPKAIKISVFLSVFDVHVNRIPASGKVSYVKYNPGKFFAAFEDKASHLNEQTEIGMETSSGHKIIFKQIAGLIARRIVCNLSDGEDVTAGDRFGMIRFGSRAELFLPPGSDIRIKVGDHVAGGETVIGYLPSESITSRGNDAQGRNVEI